MDTVREIGFKLANEWFVNEAVASTFVLKHQQEVFNGSFPDFDREIISSYWEKTRDLYLLIPEDCDRSFAEYLI